MSWATTSSSFTPDTTQGLGLGQHLADGAGDVVAAQAGDGGHEACFGDHQTSLIFQIEA